MVRVNTPLPTRPLGNTGMQLTGIGFGTWATGGGGYAFGWGAQKDEDSIEAIKHAVSLGINWIDTAAVYGLGHAEQIVSRALQDIPRNERPYVFTKCGMVWNEEDSSAVPQKIANPHSLRRELDASLQRLKVEQIDLYQMHWPPSDGTPLEDYWGTLLELKTAGKVRALGLSNHSITQLQAAEHLGHVAASQPPFSAMRRGSGKEEIPWCYKNKTGVIVYSTMQSGLLSGTFSKERVAQLPADDWRSQSPRFRDEELRKGLDFADKLASIAVRYQVTPGAIAIAWTLAWPGVTGAIVGARNASQVDDWIQAGTLRITTADLNEIATAIDQLNIGSGPSRPSPIAD